MTRAFVLGNGISRNGILLSHIREYGPIYACNAIYREFTPDVLVATDLPISTAIQESGYSNKHRFYTRKPKPNLGARPVPQKYYGYSSGPIALALACDDGATVIYMVGFDLGPTENNKFNNIYAGTEFYKALGANPTYTGNWIRQIVTVIRDYPATQFIRVAGLTTAHIIDFSGVNNLTHMDSQQFTDRINNKKNL